MTQSEVRQRFIKANPGIRLQGYSGYWYKCAHCGKWCGRPGRERARIADECKMEVDHIKPWSQGGSDELWNLQPLCKPCNRNKLAGTGGWDDLKIIKNNIIHGDIVTGGLKKAVRQNKVLKALGITKRR